MAVTSTETATRAAPADGWVRGDHPAEGVRVRVLDRRERRTSLDVDVLTRLAGELALIRTDSAVRAVILTGADGAFSSGADFALIEQLSQRPEAEVAELLAVHMRGGHMPWALPQPTIAAIDGPAVGAGMSLALACDFRVGFRTVALFASFI